MPSPYDVGRGAVIPICVTGPDQGRRNDDLDSLLASVFTFASERARSALFASVHGDLCKVHATQCVPPEDRPCAPRACRSRGIPGRIDLTTQKAPLAGDVNPKVTLRQDDVTESGVARTSPTIGCPGRVAHLTRWWRCFFRRRFPPGS
jgi:hypothetical protein